MERQAQDDPSGSLFELFAVTLEGSLISRKWRSQLLFHCQSLNVGVHFGGSLAYMVHWREVVCPFMASIYSNEAMDLDGNVRGQNLRRIFRIYGFL